MFEIQTPKKQVQDRLVSTLEQMRVPTWTGRVSRTVYINVYIEMLEIWIARRILIILGKGWGLMNVYLWEHIVRIVTKLGGDTRKRKRSDSVL